MAKHYVVGTTPLATLQADVDQLILEMQHDSILFPEGSDELITLTAGNVADTFGNWGEVAVDVTGETFSSKVATQGAHLSGLLIEDLSDDDVRYVLEFAYGDPKIRVMTHRFMSGDIKKLAAIQFIRVRAAHIPAASTVYYRMKCETPSATCEVSLRYHYHE